MIFYLKRYWQALRRHYRWLILALVPVILYLLFAALNKDTFIVTQDFTYQGNVPVAAADHPVRTQTLSALITSPDGLFLDAFAIDQLERRLHLETAWAALTQNELPRLVNASMHLDRTDDTVISLYYQGDNGELGQRFVAFYTKRLMNRVEDGAVRATAAGTLDPDWSFEPTGQTRVTAFATPWSSQRFIPASVLLLLSLLGIILVIGIIDLLDNSFRSARQVARYLDVPVLGEMPDLTALSKSLKTNP